MIAQDEWEAMLTDYLTDHLPNNGLHAKEGRPMAH